MSKFQTTFILTLFISVSSGQKNELKSFRDFDLAAISLSDTRDIVTNKIVFAKDHNLDIKESKPVLDSIVWFLSRHPKSIISLTLLKIDSSDWQLGQKQSKQVAGYLSEKGINSKRVVPTVSYGGQNSADIPNIQTRIRLLSQDFKDPDAK